jgi:hypothetical protein
VKCVGSKAKEPVPSNKHSLQPRNSILNLGKEREKTNACIDDLSLSRPIMQGEKL